MELETGLDGWLDFCEADDGGGVVEKMSEREKYFCERRNMNAGMSQKRMGTVEDSEQ